MRFIVKLEAPLVFTENTVGLAEWGNFNSVHSRATREHILKEEQHGLCCYCEKKIIDIREDCHVEHLVPRETDKSLEFDYGNLLVSCNGIGNNRKNCGHARKPGSFDSKLFLHPCSEREIALYFEFDKESGKILSSQKDDKKANYMINNLRLNGHNGVLAEARKKAYEALMDRLQEAPLSVEEKKKCLQQKLADDKEEFISYLRHCFKFSSKG